MEEKWHISGIQYTLVSQKILYIIQNKNQLSHIQQEVKTHKSTFTKFN